MKKLLTILFAGILSVSMMACGGAEEEPAATEPAPETPVTEETPETEETPATDTAGNEEFTIVTVPKATGIAWFQRMDVGVQKFAEDTGVDAYQTGPAQADAAAQAQAIEDLIAQQVDAICVVPFSTEALEPVLKKAREAGIVVIAHEASTMENIDYDIEAFNNTEYGEHFMAKMGELTGGTGEYALMVGSLTSQSHKEWTDAAIEYQKANFPDMVMVGDKIETSDDQNVAYERTKELLKAYPNLKAIQGSSMADVAGAALAVDEAGLTGKVKIVGTSLVSVSGKFVESGTIDMIGFWDPADAGYAMNELALKILKGEEVGNEVALTVPGYEKMTLDGKVFTASAWIDVDKENVGDPKYGF